MPAVATSRLPPHHIRRRRLVDACAAAQVVVVEAAGGYGKSVLAAELVDANGLVPIWVLLEDGGVPGRLLAGRLRGAVARAGLADAAAAMSASGDDPAGAIDALLGALAGESCAILIDDAHHAARDAAQLIDRMASQLGDQQMLIVLARHLPPGLERLRRAEVVQLTSRELSLTPEETLELCLAGFGLEASFEEGARLAEATGGWTAAAVLAASRAKRTAQPLATVARADRTGSDAVRAILEEALGALAPDRQHLAQIAPLPRFDARLLTQVTGEEGFLERALEAGLPATPTGGGWWELPGPVRDHLATLARPDPEALLAAAVYYEQHDQLDLALQMLLGSGQAESAARLLDQARPASVAGVDALELVSVIDRLPAALLDRYPQAMLHVARSCHAAALLERRAALIERLKQIVPEEGGPPAVRRALDAELATDLMTDGNRYLAAEELAARVLEHADSSESLTRGRALSVIGRAAYWHRDASGERRTPDLRKAGEYLEQAVSEFLRVGDKVSAAMMAPYRAVWIEMGSGRPDRGVEILNQALELVVDHPRRYAYLLQFRAEVLAELGRYEESDGDVEEVLRRATQLSDPNGFIAYANWMRMFSESQRGAAENTLRCIREVERHADEWWGVAGADFLADAADCLDRVGHTTLAWEFLGRARELPGDADTAIALTECALLARHGDPELAEQRIAEVDRFWIAPREQWRVTLLRAYASARRGAGDAGALAARAFEEATRLGQPQLPLIRERELSESLLGLAAETGLPAARALEATSLPVGLAVLGRFELSRGGRAVEIGSGQSAQLLKLVAVSGGGLQVDRAIEALWPEVDPAAGRNRLRTVLNRLRDAAEEVLERQGELLALSPAVGLDLDRFHREARQALALGPAGGSAAVAAARSAIARYRGPLLPHDPYAEWAEEPRETARRTMLSLLDLCAEVAAGRGDLDEARRMVERTIELAPYDDDRYLKVAVILADQGRKGAALAVLRRARSALSQIGIDPPPALAALEARLAAGGRPSAAFAPRATAVS